MQEWKPQMSYMEKFPVAMAYVPWQRNCNMYENLDEAFKTGTIFPELNKPFLGRRVKG
ncbi:MAG: spore coat associated protein CotJA [Lachnospiraceae bacterium]|nr:spore coat associated protein CotJA [Lachnospiraceae bacterium]